MRSRVVAAVLMILLLPWVVSAQGGMMNTPWQYPGPGMMRTVEEQSVGVQIHEDMEDLMIKMMAGTLNQSEEDRLISYMNQYPGTYGMMMSRMVGGWAMGANPYCTQWGTGYGPGMMGGWTIGFWIFMAFICIVLLVWLVVGIFLILYLNKVMAKL